MKFPFALIFLVFTVLARGQNYSAGFNASKNFLSTVENRADHNGRSFFSQNKSNSSSYSVKFNCINKKNIISAALTYNVENYNFIYHFDSSSYGSSYRKDLFVEEYFYKSREGKIILTGGLQIPLLSNSAKTSQFMVDLDVSANLFRKNKEIQDSSMSTNVHTDIDWAYGVPYTTTTYRTGNSDDVFSIYKNPVSFSFGMSFRQYFMKNIVLQLSAHYRPINHIAKMNDIVLKSYLSVGVELQYKFPCRKNKSVQTSEF